LRNGLVNADPKEPAQVLAALNRAYPMERHQNRFFTMWYGVYDMTRRKLRYATGGHPPALLFNGDPRRPEQLGSGNLIVGVDADATFEHCETAIAPGDRLYLFSDGAFEVHGRDGGMLRMLGGVHRLEDGRVDAAVDRIRRFQGDENFVDDFSLLEVTFD
jgi:sigma-B regulation protein RsbU (phosphoserine phosphatase)